MPTPIDIPSPNQVYAIKGVKLGIAQAHIRKPNRNDVLLIELLNNKTTVSGVFTQNLFCAAPVKICKQHLQKTSQNQSIKALLINTGNANAGTGLIGEKNALASCVAVANLLQIKPEQVLPFSTGVILEHLPIDRLIAGLPNAHQNQASWFDAAGAIMTTDTCIKVASKRIEINGEAIHISGISKGAGMIKPNMATMLGFIATDACIEQSMLNQLVKEVADESFNCITVDGDTSTNDSFILIATHETNTQLEENTEYLAIFKQALVEVAQDLAKKIIADGEGATKFITIDVKQAPNKQIAKQVAYAIAHSPLVKTAFFASDPNLGRILAAIGNNGSFIKVEKISMWINQVLVVSNGGLDANYLELDGQKAMKETNITITLDLAQGIEKATVWTCDLSHDYVSINADYRS